MAILLFFAFHHKEYIQGLPENNVLTNIKDVFSVKDVAMDAYHNFNPKYQQYLSAKSLQHGKKRRNSKGESNTESGEYGLEFYDDMDIYGNEEEDMTDEESFEKQDDDGNDLDNEEILIDLENGIQHHKTKSNFSPNKILPSKRTPTNRNDKTKIENQNEKFLNSSEK